MLTSEQYQSAFKHYDYLINKYTELQADPDLFKQWCMDFQYILNTPGYVSQLRPEHFAHIYELFPNPETDKEGVKIIGFAGMPNSGKTTIFDTIKGENIYLVPEQAKYHKSKMSREDYEDFDLVGHNINLLEFELAKRSGKKFALYDRCIIDHTIMTLAKAIVTKKTRLPNILHSIEQITQNHDYTLVLFLITPFESLLRGGYIDEKGAYIKKPGYIMNWETLKVLYHWYTYIHINVITGGQANFRYICIDGTRSIEENLEVVQKMIYTK